MHKLTEEGNLMANPYHDENGKFCSKDEMRAAIDNLATKSGPAAFDNYFKLRTEYETIESGKVTVSKKFAKQINTSGIYLFNRENMSAEDIRGLYNSVDLSDDKTYRSHNIVDLVNHPSTPEDIKKDVLTNAPVKLKRKLAEKGIEERSPMSASDLKKLTEGETDGDIIHSITLTRKLTFEDKYNIAKQSESGLAYLARNNGESFFSVPQLETELRDQVSTLVNEGKEKQAEEGFSPLASHSVSEASHNFVIEKSNPSVEDYHSGSNIMHLARNENISSRTGLKIAKKMLDKNIVGYAETQKNLAYNDSGTSSNIFALASVDSRRSDLKPKETAPSPELTAEFDRVNNLKNQDKEFTVPEKIDIATVEAHWNSHKENYVALMRRAKIMSKRKAPEVNELQETSKSIYRKIELARTVLAGEAFIESLTKRINK
jgi:hypothetical protein